MFEHSASSTSGSKKAEAVSWFPWLRSMMRRKPNAGKEARVAGTTAELTVRDPVDPDWVPKLKFGVESVVGNVREHNEDNFYVPGRLPVQSGAYLSQTADFNEPTVDVAPMPGPRDLFVVADGMGGQLAGEQASKIAVEIIPRQVNRRLQENSVESKVVLETIRESVADANAQILSLAGVNSEYQNMGTTVVLVFFRDKRAYVAGIGDSRAYRLRESSLERLTKDHSLADALGEAGTIRMEDVAQHKFKHVLYLYLGSKEARDGPDPREIRNLEVRPGDRFLLASDGLTGVVSDELISEVLKREEDPQRAANRLIEMALEYHSKDNVTCVVIHVD